MMTRLWLFACVLALATAPAGALDLSRAADWGPATAADTLWAHLQAARWQDDAATFHRIKSEFWQRYPHHMAVVEQVVLWNRGEQTLSVLLDALAAGTAEEHTGLDGLTPEDRLLLEGYALVSAGRLTSAQAALERVLETRPANPLALSTLYSHCGFESRDPDRKEALARTALTDSEAAYHLLRNLLISSPHSSDFVHRDKARALIAERPSRPQLEPLLASEAVLDTVRQPGLTAARFASLVDGIRASDPEVSSAYLDDLFVAAIVWLPPESLLEILEARSGWIPPRKYAICQAILLGMDDQDFEVYRTLAAVERQPGQAPNRRIIAVAPDWHSDASEVEQWARELIQENLYNNWQQVETILRERDRGASADSLREVVARETPYAMERERLQELSWNDPTACRAFLDSLVSQMGEPPFGFHLMLQAEKSGDHAFLAEFQEKYGLFLTLQNLSGAIYGAESRGDRERLVELTEWVRRHAPHNTRFLQRLGNAFLSTKNLDLYGEIVEDLAGRTPQPTALVLLKIDAAMLANEPENVRVLLEHQLDSADTPLDQLILIPRYAERAGWSDLADRSMARIEAEAPSGCRAVTFLRAGLHRQRGELEEARTMLLELQTAWPEWDAARRALVDAGGIVEPYEDPSPHHAGTSLAGLEFDYTSTDWIAARRSRPDEFPEEEFLVLRSREIFYLSSRTRLVNRSRMTVETLSDLAAEQYATIRIPFHSDGEVPRVLCARIISPTGEVREVPPGQVLVTAHQSDDADVSDMRDLVIPFAGLKAGSIVDYCYQTSSPGFLDFGHAWTYRFGGLSPQREEMLEILVAEGVEHLLYTERQPLEMERQDLPGATLYRWRLVDQPAALIEELAPVNDLLPHWVGCTTYDSWDKLAQRYGRSFWQQATLTDSIRALASRLTAEAGGDDARAEILFAHIQKEIDNIGIELGPGRLVPTPSHEVLARGYGDCKDKVAALISLASGLDLECLPVLVGTRPSHEVVDDFPCSGCFDHLIAYFPDLHGGTFSDPTLGTGCLGDLPDEVAGQRGLVIRQDGKGELVQIPEQSYELPMIELEVDLHPEPDGRLRAETTAVVRHSTASFVSMILEMPDTVITNAIVDYLAGNQANEVITVIDWEKRELDCGALELKAVFRDSSWAMPDDNDAYLLWVASTDSEVELPDDKERTLPLELDAAQRYTLTLRAHEDAVWRLSARHSPIKVSAPGFRGEVKVREHDEDDHRWLEIRREMTFSQREYRAEDFAEVRDKYYSFRIAGLQPIRYHRQSDEARLEQLRSYCREHPEDMAFSFNAARQVLGGDMGGDGEAGIERRAEARELLATALAHPDVGGMPYVLAASIAIMDDHYLEADSLVTVGLERSPRDIYLLGFAIRINRELKRDEKLVEYMHAAQSLSGDESLSYSLIGQYLTMKKDDKALQVEHRLGLIATAVDSVQLLSTKVQGYIASNRLELADSLLTAAERLFSPSQYHLLLSNIAAEERRWDDAIDALAPVLDENPLNPTLNNNMAWFLACAGQDLERAEYLIRMSLALSGDSAGGSNTLGVVLMRQDKMKEAREIFARLMEDERPEDRVVNGYFYGLCRWFEGKKDEAIASWQVVEGVCERDRFGRAVRESLELVAGGEDPSWVFLWPMERRE
jgi:tetratricopeptide (TPR) repeat protein